MTFTTVLAVPRDDASVFVFNTLGFLGRGFRSVAWGGGAAAVVCVSVLEKSTARSRLRDRVVKNNNITT